MNNKFHNYIYTCAANFYFLSSEGICCFPRLRFGRKNENFLIFILSFTHLALLCFAKLGCGSEEKNENFFDFHFVLHSPCTTLLCEVRLRFGRQNENFLIFILSFTHLALLCFAKLGCGSEEKNEIFFDFHFVLHSPCTNFGGIKI